MRFEKVSYEQYFKDVTDKMGIKEIGELSDSEINEIHNLLKEEYNNIILPKRAYRGSAGYDIYSPISFSLEAGQSIFFWTGIRVILDANKVLMIYPRSSLGTKYNTVLTNTIGVVDAR